MRAWVVCMLAAFACCACQRPPKHVAPRPVSRAPLPKPHLRGIHLGPGEQVRGDAVAEALQQGWLCLDLPGAARSSLWATGKGLRFAQLQTDVGPRRWDLVAVEPDDPTPTVLVRDVGPRPQPVQDEQVVFTRTDAATGRHSLWVGDPQHPDGVALSGPELDVTSVAVDAARHVVWCLALAQDPAVQVLYRWQPGQAALQPAPWPNPSQETGLVQVGIGADGQPLPVPRDGSHVETGGTTTVVQQPSGLVVRRVEPGAAVPLADAASPDVLLANPGGPWIVHRDGKFQRLSLVDGAALQPIAALGPVTWAGAAKLHDGVVAALLTHDTDASGAHDGEDESDVCLVARAIQPLEIAERSVPHRLVDKVDALRALLAAEGVAARTVRVIRAEPSGGLTRAPRLLVLAQGPPPQVPPLPADATEGTVEDEPTFLLHWIERLHARLAQAAGDPHLGLDVEWQDADRQALADWSGAQGRFVHRVRLGDRVVGVRDEHVLELLEDRSHGAREDGPEGERLPVCAGAVRNLGLEPLAVRVLCEDPVQSRRSQAFLLPDLPAGGTARWSFTPGFATTATHLTPRFLIGEVPVPVWDPHASEDTADWATTVTRIVREVGFQHRPAPITGEPGDPGLAHDVTQFLAPQGFASLDDKARRRLAKSLWIEVARHLARHHGEDCTRPAHGCPDLHLVDAEGHRWTVSKGVLDPEP